MSALPDLTLAAMMEVAQALRRRSISPLELARQYLAQIEDGGRLHAFISPPDATSIRQARHAAASVSLNFRFKADSVVHKSRSRAQNLRAWFFCATGAILTRCGSSPMPSWTAYRT